MKTLQAFKAELLNDTESLTAYNAMADEFATARELISARSHAGLTQSQVAQRMGTTQSVIARLEGGRSAPSLRSIQRYAKAIGCRATIRIEPMTA